MIWFVADGLMIDDEDWSAAAPDAMGVSVRFRNGARVYLTRQLLLHAQSILDTDAAMAASKESHQ